MPRIDIQRTEIDGVQVFQAPHEGNLTHAALLFRVGSADETLRTHGITHLVEHLAMRRLAPRHYHCNAFVQLTLTGFWIEGFGSEVVDFLDSVTSSLTDLPLESLEDERRILRTEEQTNTSGSINNRMMARFGAGGYGIGDYWQYGLRWLRPDDVGDWARSWFNSSNCAVWIAGDVPDELKLSLPPGERHAVPQAQPVSFQMPAITETGRQGVTISLLGPRSPEMLLATHTIHRRVQMRVRHEQGISYSTGAGYFGLDNDTAEIVVSADSTEQHLRDATESILQVIAELGAIGPTADEVAAALEEHAREGERPELTMSELNRVAIDHITGFSRNSWEALRDIFAVTEPPAVAAAIAEAARRMLVILPKRTPLNFDGLTRRSFGAQRLGSTRIAPMPGMDNRDTLYFGSEGVSNVAPDDGPVSAMTWSEIAAAPWWNDGDRLLLGTSGASIFFSPKRWQNAYEFAEALRQYVPPDRWVSMDEPGTPRTDEPRCQVCQATPAIEVHLTLWRVFRGQVQVIGVLCRDCGIAEFRRCTSSAMWVLLTPTIVWNYKEGRRIKAIGPPVRTSGIKPLKPGLPVYLRPSMLGPIALGVVFVGIIAIAVAIYQ